MKAESKKKFAITLDKSGQEILTALKKAGYTRQAIVSEGLRMLAEEKKIYTRVGKENRPHRHVR